MPDKGHDAILLKNSNRNLRRVTRPRVGDSARNNVSSKHFNNKCYQNPICMQMARMLKNLSQVSLDAFSSSVQASLDNRLGRLLRITRQQLMFLLADAKEATPRLSSLRSFRKYVKDLISRTKRSKSYKAFLRRLEGVACSGPFPYRSERRHGWRLARALYTHGTDGLPIQLAALLDPTRASVPFPDLEALTAAGKLLGMTVLNNQPPQLPDLGQRQPRFMVTYESTVEYCLDQLEQPFNANELEMRLRQWNNAAVLAGFRALPTAQQLDAAPVAALRYRQREEDDDDGPAMKRPRRNDIDFEDVELLHFLGTPPGSPLLVSGEVRDISISPTWSMLAEMDDAERNLFSTIPSGDTDNDTTAAILSALFSDSSDDSSESC